MVYLLSKSMVYSSCKCGLKFQYAQFQCKTCKLTGSRTQVTVKMSPIQPFVNIESIEVIHVSVILPGAIVHSMFLKEQHACWMNTYFKISLQMYRAFFKQ